MSANPLPAMGFLLGSGVSIPAAPSTRDLTDEVLLRGHQYYLHTDEEWYSRPGEAAGQSNARESRVHQLIPHLAAQVEAYYTGRVAPQGCTDRHCNYEDIGYQADAIASTLNRDRDDPGLMPLALAVCSHFNWSHDELLDVAHDTVAFVRDVTFRKLVAVKPPANHLRLVVEPARDPDVNPLPIITLNHECLVEDTLAAAGVPFFDFRRTDGTGRILLDLHAKPQEGARAIIYKPHGSVRWRRFRPLNSGDEGDPWFSEWTGWSQHENGTRHEDGSAWRSIGGPLMLVGRFNKEMAYLGDPYLSIYLALKQSLGSLQRLVISGYGFGDRAINRLLIDWIYGKPPRERRLVVLHDNENVLLGGARNAIAGKWQRWRDLGIPNYPSKSKWRSARRPAPSPR